MSELKRNLRRRLRLRPGTADILHNREGAMLEFKKSFSLGNLPRYARTMAAFANNQGGYLVFGVEPSPHRLIGVNRRFLTFDPAGITEFLRTHLNPEIHWQPETLEFHDVELGFIYTWPCDRRPVIAAGNVGKDLKDGEVYFRYRGQSTRIGHSELSALIDDRITSERRAWLDHLQKISQAGPLNVAILDTMGGQIHGPRSQYLISEELLDQLRFVREGQFRETEGDPTLRLIGELQPVGGVLAERAVPMAIHTEDLYRAFLEARTLPRDAARQYVREAAHQNSPYTPVLYFAQLADLSREDAVGVLQDTRTSYEATRSRLIRRVRGQDRIEPLGVVLAVQPELDTEGHAVDLQALTTPAQKRTALLERLRSSPEALADDLAAMPLLRIVEAVTHLSREDLDGSGNAIRRLLLTIYEDHFEQHAGGFKTSYRKAITHIDILLHGDLPENKS